ncbi:hypothetical protein ES703_95920 [subsurface metagenome]
MSVFAAKRLFSIIIEEESDVSIFFRLSAAELFQAQRTPICPEDIFHFRRLWKRYLCRYCCIILGHTNVIYIWFCCPYEIFEVRLNKCPCNFTRSVAAEVEEYYTIAVIDSSYRFIATIDNAGRLDEFVRYIFFITVGNRLR